jgi:hypothetical protein
MNALFPRPEQDDTESRWFKAAHALVVLLVLIALMMLVATGWESLVGALQ